MMSLQELKAFVEPLSAQEKQTLQALLRDELTRQEPPNVAQDWVQEHLSAVAAVTEANPRAEMPTDLSQTWKRTRRERAHGNR